jgi:RHS repeat-associated protein
MKPSAGNEASSGRPDPGRAARVSLHRAQELGRQWTCRISTPENPTPVNGHAGFGCAGPRADQADPARRTYRYGGLNRLTEVRDGSTSTLLQGYQYDKTGNRMRRTDGAVDQDYSYTPGKHWLHSVAGVARQYDVAGNTTRIGASSQGTPPGGCQGCMEENPGPGDPGPGPGDPPPGETESIGGASTDGGAGALAQVVREFVYDDAGRMRQVKHDGIVAMDYLYNGKGERVHRMGGGQSVTTLYDEFGKWLGDYDAAGHPIQQIIWMDDLPVGVLVGAGANQKLHYVQADALGTPRVVIDPVRNVAVWNWDLANEAFGDSSPNQDADRDGIAFVFDMRLPGQRHDSSTGGNYNYFRDYEASTGRYLKGDPIGLNGGLSLYSYAKGSPLVFVDRLGLSPNGIGVYSTNDSCELCAPARPRFDSKTALARQVLAAVYVWSRNENIELCGLICKDDKAGKYFYLGHYVMGGSTWCQPGLSPCPMCSTAAGWWHTHGAPDGFRDDDANIFSPKDQAFTNFGAKATGDQNFMGFLGTPTGMLVSYTANSAIGPIIQGRLE